MPKVLNKRTDRIPPDAIYVGRPSKWGNPSSVKEIMRLFPHSTEEEAHQWAVVYYNTYIKSRQDLLDSLHELRGKDLICWCAPSPCHADVLLELANKEVTNDNPE